MGKFPLRLQGKETRLFETLDELIDSIYDEYQSRIKLKKDVKLTDVLWYFGIVDNKGIGETMILCDERTMDILKKYDFLQANPSKINNLAWFESVSILNKLKPRLF